MSINIPPAKNYAGVFNAFPTRWNKAPNEGSKCISGSIDWDDYTLVSDVTPQTSATYFDASRYISPQLFSQICYLSVDNTNCSVDVRFVFPDTSETFVCPAGEMIRTPVFTNAVTFYAFTNTPLFNAPGQNTTNFTVHNCMPPPISMGSNSRPLEYMWTTQSDLAAAPIPITTGYVDHNYNLFDDIQIPLDQSKPLFIRYLRITVTGTGTAPWQASIIGFDGAGNSLGSGLFTSGGDFNATCIPVVELQQTNIVISNRPGQRNGNVTFRVIGSGSIPSPGGFNGFMVNMTVAGVV